MAKNDTYWDNLTAVYLDGKATPTEVRELLAELKVNPSLRETLDICVQTDEEQDCAYPMLRMAAETKDNLCDFLCELYILKQRGIECASEDLLAAARANQWVQPSGTPLHAIGQLLASQGLMVTRQYEATLGDIKSALDAKNEVIAVVDSDKLYPERPDEEDAPNHAVVVLAVDEEQNIISLFEPEVCATMEFALSDFLKAWHESRNYLVRVLRSIDDYEPHPLNLEAVPLTEDLQELQEAIAENAHEVWAAARKAEGWTYGPVRNDALKQHPDLIPYSALPDSEKEYDRLMAFNTIKLVKKLGWKIVK